jgi:hypothetical protein
MDDGAARWIVGLSGDPTERAMWRALSLELHEAIASCAASEAIAQLLLRATHEMLLSSPEDMIETVALTAPGTNNLVIRVGIKREFYLALARAAKDGEFTHGRASHN